MVDLGYRPEKHSCGIFEEKLLRTKVASDNNIPERVRYLERDSHHTSLSPKTTEMVYSSSSSDWNDVKPEIGPRASPFPGHNQRIGLGYS